jgi:hypothetical protein
MRVSLTNKYFPTRGCFMIKKKSIKASCKEILYKDIEILTTISCEDFGGDIGDFIMEIFY